MGSELQSAAVSGSQAELAELVSDCMNSCLWASCYPTLSPEKRRKDGARRVLLQAVRDLDWPQWTMRFHARKAGEAQWERLEP
jgi:hypothetical protein